MLSVKYSEVSVACFEVWKLDGFDRQNWELGFLYRIYIHHIWDVSKLKRRFCTRYMSKINVKPARCGGCVAMSA